MTDMSALAEQVGETLQQQGRVLATAESCTGGWVAKLVTDVAGSSQWFDRGFVTYSNQAKIEMLGVSATTLDRFGAVSRETVIEMASGALAFSRARLSVAVSGIAGPGGGSPGRPVGTVWFAWAGERGVEARCEVFAGDRLGVRAATVDCALAGLLERAR